MRNLLKLKVSTPPFAAATAYADAALQLYQINPPHQPWVLTILIITGSVY